MALQAGYRIGNIFFCEEILDKEISGDLLSDDKLLVPVSKVVFDKIAIRESTGGILAVAEQRREKITPAGRAVHTSFVVTSTLSEHHAADVGPAVLFA